LHEQKLPVNKCYDVVVIGAGASGLMCAYQAAIRGRRVLVLERSNKAGKKILMSGGGRCNFTNMEVTPANFVCDNPHFVKSALKRYSHWDFIGMVCEYGVAYHERKHGQLFCDDSAKDILNILLDKCASHKVDIVLKSDVTSIKRYVDPNLNNTVSTAEDSALPAAPVKRYTVISDKGEYAVESLVVASGGLSIPTLGGSGLGYEIANKFGLKLIEQRAGLVPFTFSDVMKPVCERLSGIAVHVGMSTENGATFFENLLFTHRGMSGPVVLQASNYWRPGEVLTIDLLPGVDAAEALLNAKKQHPKQQVKSIIGSLQVYNGEEFTSLPKKLIVELQALLWPAEADKTVADIKDARLMDIACSLNAWQLKPSGTEGYRTAEVTLGGVSSDELSSKTMEAKKAPGLFFIGEVVEVSGQLGGFNFQWAWSSGYAAGQYV
jgi:hypothetical protein